LGFVLFHHIICCALLAKHRQYQQSAFCGNIAGMLRLVPFDAIKNVSSLAPCSGVTHAFCLQCRQQLLQRMA